MLAEWPRGGNLLYFARALLKLLPPSTDLLSKAESVLPLGKSAPPVAVTRTASVCRRAHGTGKEPLPGEQEDDGKRNVPVCLSQNESVPLLVPVLPGISIKDSWLFGSACQYISTTRKH